MPLAEFQVGTILILVVLIALPIGALVFAMGAGGALRQIGKGDYRPSHFEYTRFLAPPEFRARIEESTAVVAHAGTGTIIEVLEREKPLLVMPRITRLGETRNDHQIASDPSHS
jgi:UDP-N-acetylglucosamine transferase subunit ALG13